MKECTLMITYVCIHKSIYKQYSCYYYCITYVLFKAWEFQVKILLYDMCNCSCVSMQLQVVTNDATIHTMYLIGKQNTPGGGSEMQKEGNCNLLCRGTHDKD